MPVVFQPPFVTMLVVLSAWLFIGCLVHGRPLSVCGVRGRPGRTGLLVYDVDTHPFTSQNTTLFVGKPSSQLVCEGPFRFSRNPMYVGVMVFLVDLALWVGTWPFYMTAPVTFLFLNFFQANLRGRIRMALT